MKEHLCNAMKVANHAVLNKNNKKLLTFRVKEKEHRSFVNAAFGAVVGHKSTLNFLF